jgi:hypothetical protein
VAIQKAPPSTAELIALGAPIVLRDGSRIRLRQGHRSDKALLLRGFARLSPESRHRRFLGATPKMSGETVRYLTEIDHHDHEAIAALDEETGDGIGIARYHPRPRAPRRRRGCSDRDRRLAGEGRRHALVALAWQRDLPAPASVEVHAHRRGAH